MGNLIPIFFWLPPAAAGVIWAALTHQFLGPPLLLLGFATVVGWFAMNAFGLYDSGRMRLALERILTVKGEKLPDDRVFVGFATPGHAALLDAHEDVGFLLIHPDRLRFVSETRDVSLPKAEVKDVRFRMNPHTVLGLGRWVSVEGESEGVPIRLLVEPRERRTMLGNLRETRPLRERLRRWMKA